MQTIGDVPAARRFVRELLKQTRGDKPASLDLISTYASCSVELSEELASELGLQVKDGTIKVSPESRLDIAMSEASRGFLQNASRFLDWRDFERFAERCLREMDFETMKDVRLKADGRNWQIDVTGIKDRLLVCLDCKHWAPPMSPSRFKDPETHQLAATRVYATKLATQRNSEIISLPVIVTLFEPPKPFSEKVVIVDIQKLPSMLRDLTPYTPDLPFMTIGTERGENPISHSTVEKNSK